MAEGEECERMMVLANAFNCPREMGETMALLRDVKVTREAT